MPPLVPLQTFTLLGKDALIPKSAQERQKKGGPSDSDEGGRTDDQIGEFVGMGKDKLRKAEFVVDSAEEDPRFTY